MNHELRKNGKRLPPVPLPTVALDPEQQVGSAVTATGLPPKRRCTHAVDSARPRGKYLGSKVSGPISNTAGGANLFDQKTVSEFQLLVRTQYCFHAIGKQAQSRSDVSFERLVLRFGMK